MEQKAVCWSARDWTTSPQDFRVVGIPKMWQFDAQVMGAQSTCCFGCDASILCACIDIDECQISNGNCEQMCVNTIGSYMCNCSEGFMLNEDLFNCSGMISFCCADSVVMTSHVLYIVDIDECVEGSDSCDTNATCTNTIGNYTCMCNLGYSGDGFACSSNDFKLILCTFTV